MSTLMSIPNLLFSYLSHTYQPVLHLRVELKNCNVINTCRAQRAAIPNEPVGLLVEPSVRASLSETRLIFNRKPPEGNSYLTIIRINHSTNLKCSPSVAARPQEADFSQ